MEKQDFIDRVLIKLRREYSENEVIQALSNRLSKAEQKNGELVSTIDELEYEILKLRQHISKINQKKNRYKKKLKEGLSSGKIINKHRILKLEIEELKNERIDLLNKNYSLLEEVKELKSKT